MPANASWILPFETIGLADLASVGGKNASLGELISRLGQDGIRVPEGFAITATAYRAYLETQGLGQALKRLLSTSGNGDDAALHRLGTAARALVLQTPLPAALCEAITTAFMTLAAQTPGLQVAVRSSATAEDLPDASFAGQQESFLNIRTPAELLDACRHCYASLFTDRAIAYRRAHGYADMDVALSIGVQRMVRSDKGSSGVCFTIDPETGCENVILVTGSWGLGENVVQGSVNPDEFYLFKPGLDAGKFPIVARRLGSKALTMVYAEDAPVGLRRGVGVSGTIVNLDTPRKKQVQYVLADSEVIALAQACRKIEAHYGRPMDIEWAKDGLSGEVLIVQARPETVHSRHGYQYHAYHLRSAGPLLVEGKNIGDGIAAGRARVLHSPADSDLLTPGEVLVTGMTNPDWDPILKKAAAIVTDKGGRTSHAAIVARETGGGASDQHRDSRRPRRGDSHRPLRSGSQRPPRLCPFSSRSGHRQHFVQSRRPAQGHREYPRGRGHGA